MAAVSSNAVRRCFCAEPDLLSQWRAYSKNGAGYSIGFAPQLLTTAVQPMAFRLLPRIYSEEEQIEIIRQLFNEAREVYDAKDDHRRDDLFWQGVIRSAAELAMCFKSRHFCEEKEWRVFSGSPVAAR